jgi:hypothetical protein
MVEVGLILLHDLAQMALIQDQEEVQAFSPHAAQKSLAYGIGLRLSWPKLPSTQKSVGSTVVTQKYYLL